jgi:hypothetical protein
MLTLESLAGLAKPEYFDEFLREMRYVNYGIEPHFRGIRCIPDGQPHCDP